MRRSLIHYWKSHLAVAGGAMMGSVRFDDQVYEVVYAGGRTHQVRQIDPENEKGLLEQAVDRRRLGARQPAGSGAAATR